MEISSQTGVKDGDDVLSIYTRITDLEIALGRIADILQPYKEKLHESISTSRIGN